MPTHPLITASPDKFLKLLIGKWKNLIIREMRLSLAALVGGWENERILLEFESFYRLKISEGKTFKYENGAKASEAKTVEDLAHVAGCREIRQRVTTIVNHFARPKKEVLAEDIANEDESQHFENMRSVPPANPLPYEGMDLIIELLLQKDLKTPKKLAQALFLEDDDETIEYLGKKMSPGQLGNFNQEIERLLAEEAKLKIKAKLTGKKYQKRRYIRSRACEWLRSRKPSIDPAA